MELTRRAFLPVCRAPEKDVDWIDSSVEGIYRFLAHLPFATRNLPIVEVGATARRT